MKSFIITLLPYAISLASVLTALYSLKSNKDIKKFEIYTEKKAIAYSSFLKEMAYLYECKEEQSYPLASSYYQAALFASQETIEIMGEIVAVTANTNRRNAREAKEILDRLIPTMQKDLMK